MCHIANAMYFGGQTHVLCCVADKFSMAVNGETFKTTCFKLQSPCSMMLHLPPGQSSVCRTEDKGEYQLNLFRISS